MKNQAKRECGHMFRTYLVAALISFAVSLSSSHAQEGSLLKAESAIKVATPMLDEGGVEAAAVADDNMADENETATDEDNAELAKSETPNKAQVIQPAFSVAQFDPSLFSSDVIEMAEQLHRCYIRGSLEGGSKRQTINFIVARNGKLDGAPKVKNSASLTGSAKWTYLNALIAIETCGPYPPRFADRSYEAEFDGVGLTSLIDLSTVETLWDAASKASFDALKLDRKAIAEIQARLKLIGFDPNGIDGVVGRGTRKAISSWQESRDIPVTGFLDQPQYSALRKQSEDTFWVWAEVPDNKKILERAATRRDSKRVGRYYRGRDGCLRTKPDNRRNSILLGRSKYCNLRAFGLK